MKRTVILFLTVVTALLSVSCAKSFKDIKVTECDLVSISPHGLSALDAQLDLGIDNPAVQVTVSAMTATLKMDGKPCMHFTADDLTLAPKSKQTYHLTLHGLLDSDFNPFALLSLLKQPDLQPMTVDFSYRGALKSGIGKDFVYKDIPLKDLLGQL